MSSPTTNQQSVLDNTSRIRVVRAVPGSGKTWLVAEIIRQEVGKWTSKGCGIAALSFTRVGGDEIRNAIGYELDHPHFIGTIDAFLFRYVVRPFLHNCFPEFPNPRLIPGEWGAEHWNKYGPEQETTVGKSKSINLFGCLFIDENQDKAVVAYKPHWALPLQPLTGRDLDLVRKGKMQLWKTTGYLTHSDAALWACKILDHKTLGGVVRAEIVNRFPLIIVDELQDTGFFLGKSIRLLLNEKTVRGVLVGDPDQAIYEFNGARPDLFDEFEKLDGAESLPLASSRRCPPDVVNVAKHVKDSGGEICPAADKKGTAFLVKYRDMKVDVDLIARTIANARTGSIIKIITRSNQTIEDLVGRHSVKFPKLGCPAIYHIHRGVVAFRQGRQVAALAAANAALDMAVFKHEGVNLDILNQSKIDPRDWKELSIHCLLRVNALPPTGTMFDWYKDACEILEAEIAAFGLDPSLNYASGNLKPQKRGDWEKPSVDYLPNSSATNPIPTDMSVQTVHGVKGETHDVTIFVCSPSIRADRCPSVIWWSADAKDREEKRIAYVALTRTQGDLIVCVTEDCYSRLVTLRPQFIADFKCLTVDEFVEAL